MNRVYKRSRTLASLALLFMAGAAHADTFIDLTNGTTGWTTAGNVTTSSTTVAFTAGGAPFSLTPANGYSLARIGASGAAGAPNATLGLSANSLESFLNNANGSITNFGLMTNTFAFNVGTYTFAWAYAAEDYQPYNDGAIFSLVGNGTQSLISLARNGSSPTDTSGPSPDTLILGSYGSTAWLTTSFDITTAGNYQVGFAAYNWKDTSLTPNLFVSGIEGTFTGTPVQTSGSTPPVIGGTGGNVEGDVFDPSSPAYAAPTLTFAGGTLQYTSDSTTNKDAVLTGPGGAIDTNGKEVSYTGEISGTGAFAKAGEGTLSLTNTNTFTGATTISEGTLALSGSGNIAASSNIVNDGMLDISGTTSGTSVQTMSGAGIVNLGAKELILTNASSTFAGDIAGTGSLKITAGTLTLSGNSSYTGGTTVSDGAALVISSDSALGVGGTLTLQNATFANAGSASVTKPIVINGTSTIDTTPGTEINTAGVFSGTGNILKTGSGKLVLAADNSAFGQPDGTSNIIVNAGTLEVTNSGALGNAALTLNGGTFSAGTSLNVVNKVTVAPSTSFFTASNSVLTVNAPITMSGAGSGCFEKTGTGSLVMSGQATIDTGTCVQQGNLYANGQLNSVVTVQSSGTLRGTGIINGVVNVSGTIAPGNSPGVLQTTASVVMADGSTFQEDINGTGTTSGPGSYSRLILSGAESQFVASGGTLAPNLVNVTGSDTYIPYVPQIGDAFRIVTAEGGIVGEFAGLTQPEGLADATRMAVYYNVGNSNSIDLFVVPTSYGAYVQAHDGNENASSSAAVLDTLAASKAAGTESVAQEELLYSVSAQTDATLEANATALAGEVHGALAAAAPLATRWLVDSVSRQLSYDLVGNDSGAWVDVGANRSDWESDSTASGFDTTRSQVAIGWNLINGEAARFGVGFSHGKVDVDASASSGSVTHDMGFVYGQLALSRVVFDGVASFGGSDWEADRSDPVAPVSTLKSDMSGHDTMISAGLRLPLKATSLALSPYARATWERVSRDSLDEGASSVAALSAPSYSASGVRFTAGACSVARMIRTPSPPASPISSRWVSVSTMRIS